MCGERGGLGSSGLCDARFLFDDVPSLFVLVGLDAVVHSDVHSLFRPAVVVVVAAAWQAAALDLVPVDTGSTRPAHSRVSVWTAPGRGRHWSSSGEPARFWPCRSDAGT